MAVRASPFPAQHNALNQPRRMPEGGRTHNLLICSRALNKAAQHTLHAARRRTPHYAKGQVKSDSDETVEVFKHSLKISDAKGKQVLSRANVNKSVLWTCQTQSVRAAVQKSYKFDTDLSVYQTLYYKKTMYLQSPKFLVI